MKKSFLIAALIAMISTNASAQIVINNSGRTNPVVQGAGSMMGLQPTTSSQPNATGSTDTGYKTLAQRRQERAGDQQQWINKNINNSSINIQAIPNNNAVQQINPSNPQSGLQPQSNSISGSTINR